MSDGCLTVTTAKNLESPSVQHFFVELLLVADPNVDTLALLLVQTNPARLHVGRKNNQVKSSRREFGKGARIGSFLPGFDFLVW